MGEVIRDGAGSGYVARVSPEGRLHVDSNISYNGSIIGATQNDGSTCLNTITPDIFTTGSLTALNGVVNTACMGQSSAFIDCRGTWKGTIYVEGSIDNTNWNILSLFQPVGTFSRSGIMNDNQNGLYRIVIIAGYKYLRARMSSYTSGQADIIFNLSSATGTNYVWQLNQANLNATVYQGGSPWAVSGTSNIKFIDNNGSVFGVKQINNKIRVSSMPYLYDIAEGNVPDHTSWSKTGYNNSIGTTMEDMWGVGTPYVFPLSGMRLYVTSTSASDTKSGVGIQEVRIRYLDQNYNEKSEIVSMSGTTIVPTAGSDFYRINSFRATNCGASGVSIGNITVGSGTTYYSFIGSTFTRARNSIYTVPGSKCLYVTSIAFSATAADSSPYKPASVRFTTKATMDDLGSNINFFMPCAEVLLSDAAYTKTLEIPTKLCAKTDLKVSAISNVAGPQGTCSLRGWIE
jgi:hypothetical protein